jgi:hypothetical protein
MSIKRPSHQDLPPIETDEEAHRWLADNRPTTRAECINGPRPCPYVGCAFHLFLNVNSETGEITLNVQNEPLADIVRQDYLRVPDPDSNKPVTISDIEGLKLGIEAMPQTCALDVADHGGQAPTRVAEYIDESLEKTNGIIGRAERKFKDRFRRVTRHFK